MTDHPHPLEDPSDAELDALTTLLARTEPWDELPRALEDSVVDAITSESANAAPANAARAGVTTGSSTDARARRNRFATRGLAAAAAIVAIVAGVALLTRGDSGGVSFALEGTESQPDASAEVRVWATPAGLKILLDTDGLPGAPDGYMYEAWVGDGAIGVSAGTFHLRGGHGTIELWAGVTGPGFDRIWITLEPIDDDAASSSDARLRGRFSLSDD